MAFRCGNRHVSHFNRDSDTAFVGVHPTIPALAVLARTALMSAMLSFADSPV